MLSKKQYSKTKTTFYFTICKILFSVLFSAIALALSLSLSKFLCQLLEIAFLFVICDWLATHNKLVGRIASCLLFFLLNMQIFFLVFASTYLSPILVSNAYNIHALNGEMSIYIPCIFVIAAVSFLPIDSILPSEKIQRLSLILFGLLEIIICFSAGTLSPLYNYGYLIYRLSENKVYEDSLVADNEAKKYFYKAEVIDAVSKPEILSNEPSIILIFTEGLSQHIIDDDRDVMRNTKYWQSRSLRFTNYYNHTFATYRGLIGQLYSGYQLNDTDENHLISLQSILRDNGYHTIFINTEPYNETFSDYIHKMNFDDVIGDNTASYTGISNTMSDKEAYATLQDCIESRELSDSPFFIAIYTFGTHASFDSTDEIFGNGDDAELNKFYNLDVQFGHFMDWFVQSKATDDVLLVFTTDHATYADMFYYSAFPNIKRDAEYIDTIPLFLYYKGIEPSTIDANGKNSLDLAPTILDYSDISGPSFFLGTSLFRNNESTDYDYDTIFYQIGEIMTTKGGIINSLNRQSLDLFSDDLKKYFSAKLWDNIDDSYSEQVNSIGRINAEINYENNTLTVVFRDDQLWEEMKFPTWSAENGQDDIIWYHAEKKNDTLGTYWECVVDLNNHPSKGLFYIHVYGVKDGITEFVDQTSAFVNSDR